MCSLHAPKNQLFKNIICKQLIKSFYENPIRIDGKFCRGLYLKDSQNSATETNPPTLMRYIYGTLIKNRKTARYILNVAIRNILAWILCLLNQYQTPAINIVKVTAMNCNLCKKTICSATV